MRATVPVLDSLVRWKSQMAPASFSMGSSFPSFFKVLSSHIQGRDPESDWTIAGIRKPFFVLSTCPITLIGSSQIQCWPSRLRFVTMLTKRKPRFINPGPSLQPVATHVSVPNAGTPRNPHQNEPNRPFSPYILAAELRILVKIWCPQYCTCLNMTSPSPLSSF